MYRLRDENFLGCGNDQRARERSRPTARTGRSLRVRAGRALPLTRRTPFGTFRDGRDVQPLSAFRQAGCHFGDRRFHTVFRAFARARCRERQRPERIGTLPFV